MLAWQMIVRYWYKLPSWWRKCLMMACPSRLFVQPDIFDLFSVDVNLESLDIGAAKELPTS